MSNDIQILPAKPPGETYTDSNFVLVQTNTFSNGQTVSDVDHVLTAKREDDTEKWIVRPVVNSKPMSHKDAIDAAVDYSVENEVKLIYKQHDTEVDKPVEPQERKSA